MANLYGRLQGYKADRMTPSSGEATRLADGKLRTTGETHKGRIETVTTDDGDFVVLLGTKDGAAAVIARGNVGDCPVLGRSFIAGDGKVRQVDDAGKIAEADPIRVQFKNPEVLEEFING